MILLMSFAGIVFQLPYLQDINIETLSDKTNQQLRAAFQRFDKLAMVRSFVSLFEQGYDA